MKKMKLFSAVSVAAILSLTGCSGGTEGGENRTDYTKVSDNLYEATISSLVATDRVAKSESKSSVR